MNNNFEFPFFWQLACECDSAVAQFWYFNLFKIDSGFEIWVFYDVIKMQAQYRVVVVQILQQTQKIVKLKNENSE